MPVFVVDGKQYRVPLKTLFKGNKNVRDQRINDALKPKLTLEQATATRPSGTKNSFSIHEGREDNHKPADKRSRSWLTREDQILRNLVAFRVPWSRISVALGNRPIDDVKERWEYIRNGKVNNVGVGAVSTAKVTQSEPKPGRHVSFSDPLVTAGNTDDGHNGSSHPPKIKKVYYIDEEFSLEDVVMLDNIAAKWERDRWLAISTRFNDMTGRKITPEQAKSVVDN